MLTRLGARVARIFRRFANPHHPGTHPRRPSSRHTPPSSVIPAHYPRRPSSRHTTPVVRHPGTHPRRPSFRRKPESSGACRRLGPSGTHPRHPSFRHLPSSSVIPAQAGIQRRRSRNPGRHPGSYPHPSPVTYPRRKPESRGAAATPAGRAAGAYPRHPSFRRKPESRSRPVSATKPIRHTPPSSAIRRPIRAPTPPSFRRPESAIPAHPAHTPPHPSFRHIHPSFRRKPESRGPCRRPGPSGIYPRHPSFRHLPPSVIPAYPHPSFRRKPESRGQCRRPGPSGTHPRHPSFRRLPPPVIPAYFPTRHSGASRNPEVPLNSGRPGSLPFPRHSGRAVCHTPVIPAQAGIQRPVSAARPIRHTPPSSVIPAPTPIRHSGIFPHPSFRRKPESRSATELRQAGQLAIPPSFRQGSLPYPRHSGESRNPEASVGDQAHPAHTPVIRHSGKAVCHSPRHSGASRNPEASVGDQAHPAHTPVIRHSGRAVCHSPVIPAQAGIQRHLQTPAGRAIAGVGLG